MRTTLGILIVLLFCSALAHAQTPSNLVAESPASLQPHVKLTWNAPDGVAFFKIYRSTPDTINFHWIGISATRQFDDSSVVAGVQYYYAVTAISRKDTVFAESPRSAIASIRAYALGPGPKGVIAGIVTDAVSGTPVKNIIIRFFRLPSPTNRGLDITTSSVGTFSAVVDTGVYIIRAEEGTLAVSVTPHVTQWYLQASGPDDATRVPVKANDTTRITFPLAPATQNLYAYVSGIVTDSLGQPLPGAVVAFLRPIQELVTPTASAGSLALTGSESAVIPGIGYARGVAWWGYTSTSGKYSAQVPGHRQYVAVAVKYGYYPRYYDNVADPTQANIIPVVNDTIGINFRLRSKAPTSKGSVEGTVEDSSGMEVPSRIILFPRPKEGNTNPIFTYTDSLGYFLVEDVEEGAYTILAVPFSDYAPSFATSSGTTAVSWLSADTVIVNALKPTVRISVPTLAKTGLTRVSGRVTEANGTPIPGVSILASQPANVILGYGMTDRDGLYAVEALGSGAITLRADRLRYNIVEAPVTIAPSTFTVGNVDFVLTSSYPLSVNEEEILPSQTALFQNYPNPFNPTTKVRYVVGGVVAPSESEGPEIGNRQQPVGSIAVKLAVYDLLGREVAVLVDEQKNAGTYAVTWNATGMATGIYVYRLTSNGTVTARKMLFMK
jgi:hypothetical protein